MDENDKELTISQLSEIIKENIKKISNSLWLIGEISNVKISKNHLYATLKDNEASINLIMWNYYSKNKKNDDLLEENKDIENGKKIKVYGKVQFYAKGGNFNFCIEKYKILGIGNLDEEYKLLKAKYENLGYFDNKRKKKWPKIIKKIGILTSVEGAALQDFLFVMKNHNYIGKIIIKSSYVQGNDCPSSIVNGLQILDKKNLDLIVITRGGGKFEDLFGFSDYRVIEEIYKSKTFIISAIGHEIDFMLSDFVADFRAPTPSLAAEAICKNNVIKNKDILEMRKKIENILDHKIIRLEKNLLQINKKNESIKTENLMMIQNFNKNLMNLIEKKIEMQKLNLNLIKKSVKSATMNAINSENQNINTLECLNQNDETIKTKKEMVEYLLNNEKLKLKFNDGVLELKVTII